MVGHEARCEEYPDGNIKSVGELLKRLMENKSVEGISSVCMILGESYCSWKDRKLKKLAKSQNIAVHSKYHEDMPWNGIIWSCCLYRTTVILAVLM